MKRRVRKIANFFAFNLLFFALYLNFIHKDNAAANVAIVQPGTQSNAAFSGTVLVENPEKYLNKKSEQSTATAQQPVAEKATSNEALKLSIN
jgi:hypothetical protein